MLLYGHLNYLSMYFDTFIKNIFLNSYFDYIGISFGAYQEIGCIGLPVHHKSLGK